MYILDRFDYLYSFLIALVEVSAISKYFSFAIKENLKGFKYHLWEKTPMRTVVNIP